MSEAAHKENSPDVEATDYSELHRLISGLGYEVVDIAGFLDSVHQMSDAQLETLKQSHGGLHSLRQANDAVIASAAKVATSSKDALDAVDQSVETMRAASGKSQSVSAWVANFEGRITGVADTLASVRKANHEVTDIAVQVNMLAINSGIEAARAGDAGRGFAIIASAIKELAQSTTQAAKDIADQTTHLTDIVQALKSEAQDIATDAQCVLEQSSAADQALGKIAHSIQQTSHDAQDMAAQAKDIEHAGASFAPAFDKLSTLAQQTADGVTQASARSAGLIDRSEAIVQQAATLSNATPDTRFIYYVQDAADRIRDLWEAAVAAGQITMGDLFDDNHVPMPGTDPAQFKTKFTKFTDATLPDIQEPALSFDPKVVFCAAVDKSGYLPTHNRKFSQPLSDDAVWNASNCRNRRIFDDRVGLKSGQNTKPFLLQVYRRDMGGGNFTMMKDLSAPIMVNGRHWGGLRMAYMFD